MEQKGEEREKERGGGRGMETRSYGEGGRRREKKG